MRTTPAEEVSARALAQSKYYEPNAFEVATAWVHGLVALTQLPTDSSNAPTDVRQAFRQNIRDALTGATCYVLFSGGRDSSAVLAVATAVARQEGMDDPVPVTFVYPGVAQADESEPQETVIRHLRLDEWVRLEVEGGTDLLATAATESLKRRGLAWPAPLHTYPALLAQLGPGALLTGEGGDEVLGPRRACALANVASLSRVNPKLLAKETARSVLPRPARYGTALYRWRRRALQPWLRPEVAEEHLRLLARDDASEPFRWDRSLIWATRRRTAVMLSHNFRLLAAEFGLQHREPFLNPLFVAALGRSKGPLGYPSRTAAMRALFGDLLPATVIERRQKAMFNNAYMSEATREFARTWDGTGLSTDLVDPERLRQEWLSEVPSALSMLPLQAAWLRAARREQQATRER